MTTAKKGAGGKKRSNGSQRTLRAGLSAGAVDLLIGTLLKPLRLGSARSALLAELGCDVAALEAAMRETAVLSAVRDAAAAAVVEAIPGVLYAQLARALEDKVVAKDFLAAVGVLAVPGVQADEAGVAATGFEKALLTGLREALGLPFVAAQGKPEVKG